jgi:IS1 family transposase
LVGRYRSKRHHRHLWGAVSRLTRQGLAFFVGDRSWQSPRTLWSRGPPAYRRTLAYTDAYEVYAAVFRPWPHRPSPEGSGRTSVAGGPNNRWRNRLAGLGRSTVGTRCEVELVRRLRLVVDQHNHRCRRIDHLGWHPLSTQ